MKIIGKERLPFAIRGGGHASNPEFSSTRGIQISMRRLSTITYHREQQTVDLGAGLTWGRVYTALEHHNVTVNGGRHDSVGVAGIILGGGYGWKTNQYGLSMDTVIEYEVRQLRPLDRAQISRESVSSWSFPTGRLSE